MAIHSGGTTTILVDGGGGEGEGTSVPNGLVTGGGVFYETGTLTFRVSAATYYIGGTLFSSVEQTVVLTAADATNPRIDVLVLDTSGTLAKVTGTAAAAPSEPDIDPTTQLKLTFVLVPATETSLSGITNESIYLENTEWTSSSSGSTWALASTNNPYAGTKCVEGTNVANAAYVQFDKGAPASLSAYHTLAIFIRSKAAWNANRVLRAQWYAEGVAKGQAITIASGYWGFNSSITTGYQLLAIPMAQFVIPSGTLLDQLRITDVGGAIGFYLDNIVLQAQGTTISTPIEGITQAQGDARYAQRGNNLSDLASAPTARTNLGLGTSAIVNTGTSGATIPLLNGANTHSGLATFSAGLNITPAAAPATNAGGYLGSPQMSDQDDYTLVMADAGCHYYHVSGSAHTLTIPANGSVAFPIGTVVDIVNENGGGVLSLVITTDTLRWGANTGTRSIAANGTASILKVTATVWRLTGSGIT